MTHSKFPWTTHPHTPTAVFDGDGRRIIDQWVAPEGWRDIETAPRGAEDTFLVCAKGDDRGAFVVRADILWRARRSGTPSHLGLSYLTHWMPLPAPPSDKPTPTPTPLDPDTAAANAVMIAAIPEMLAALEAYEVAIDEAEAIFGGEYADHYGPMFDLAMKARDVRRAALASIGRTM